jgi:predicted nucleotidyltransferase component of viral defense system
MNDELDKYKNLLPTNTINAWRNIIKYIPQNAYLAGGTALALYLRHRVSRDLDFFVAETFDSKELLAKLEKNTNFNEVMSVCDGTLNILFNKTKVQFLEAVGQKNISNLTSIAGIDVIGIPDLLALKLKVIEDRGAWRDYYDLFMIDSQTEYSIEQGLIFFLKRFGNMNLQNYMVSIPKALGHYDDITDDFGVTEKDISNIKAHFRTRLSSIIQKAESIIKNFQT